MFNKKRIEALEIENARLQSQINNALSQIETVTKTHDENADKINYNFNKVEHQLTEIKSNISKAPKEKTHSQTILEENSYCATIRDEEGNIVSQVKITPDSMTISADKITLNGKGISSAQI